MMTREQREQVQHAMGVMDMLAGMRGMEVNDGVTGVVIGELEMLQAMLDKDERQHRMDRGEKTERVTCDADG